MIKRCEKLNHALSSAGLDGMLLSGSINGRYFSGFTGGEAYLLISQQCRVLFTDSRYTIQAAMESGSDFEIRRIDRANEVALIDAAIQEFGIHSLGYEDAVMSCAEFADFGMLHAELVPASAMVDQIRQIKDEQEIEWIQQAQKISEQAFADTLPYIHPGAAEFDIATELLYRIRKNGGEGPSFDPIIASGPNGALPHAVPGQRKLQPGDLVVMDFGSLYHGYCSDMTRTVAIGEIDAELQRIYQIALQANRMAEEALCPGISGKELDAIARDHIVKCGYGAFFGHSLGHGFGLQIHEAPYAGPSSGSILQPGMTVTVEPGIYLEGKGGVRIEDCCLVTENGKRNFVSVSKELITLE